MIAQHGGAVQVKALPELWIPFSLPFSPPPPSADDERSTCQDSFLRHKGCIHLDLRKHVGKKRKKKNSLIAGVEENKRGFHVFLSRTKAFWSNRLFFTHSLRLCSANKPIHNDCIHRFGARRLYIFLVRCLFRVTRRGFSLFGTEKVMD